MTTWKRARTRNDTPPRHPVPVDLDALTEAIDDLTRHRAECAECDALLPDAECEERAKLKASWRRAIREGGRMVAGGATPEDGR